jgi:hypothetical protein
MFDARAAAENHQCVAEGLLPLAQKRGGSRSGHDRLALYESALEQMCCTRYVFTK